MKNGIGLDWGLKTLITCSNGFRFTNFNTHKDYKDLLIEKEKIREAYKNDSNGRMWALNKQNTKIAIYRDNYFRKIINKIIKEKPEFIIYESIYFEDVKNEIHKTYFKVFFNMLKNSCEHKNVELRRAQQFYPSSKICSRCGYLKDKLELSERIFKCDYCNAEIDRDLNASINIRDTKNYTRVI